MLIFILLWIVFQGRLTAETMVVGVLLSVAVYYFCVRFMGYNREAELRIIKGLFRGLRYVAVLIRETAKSNAMVSRIVYARTIEVEPRIVFFKTDLKAESSRVALANSITLTPGTITVAVNDDEFCVHCLNEDMADGIEDSSFVRLLRKMEES